MDLPITITCKNGAKNLWSSIGGFENQIDTLCRLATSRLRAVPRAVLATALVALVPMISDPRGQDLS